MDHSYDRTLDLGSVGISVGAADSSLAATAEQLGYETVWIPGGQLDQLAPLHELVHATRTARIAPAIISIDNHSAAEVAALFHDLERDAPGRFVVGLGGPQLGAHPLAALGAYLDELDESGVPAHRRLLAALGPRKLALARDRCGGAITLLTTPAHTADARAVLGVDRVLVVDLMVALDPDAGRAREAAREPLRFLSQVAGYRTNFARMGFTDLDIDTLSDDLVDALVAHGDAATIVARVADHHAAGADHVVLTPLTTEGTPGVIDTVRVLAADLPVGAPG